MPAEQDQTSKGEVAIPNSTSKIGVEVTLVPADQFPETLHNNTNVAKVNVAGKDFFAVVGKTTVA